MPNKRLSVPMNTQCLQGHQPIFFDGSTGPSGTGIFRLDSDESPSLALFEFRETTNRNVGVARTSVPARQVRLKQYERKFIPPKPYFFKLDKLPKQKSTKTKLPRIVFPSKEAKRLWMLELKDKRRGWQRQTTERERQVLAAKVLSDQRYASRISKNAAVRAERLTIFNEIKLERARRAQRIAEKQNALLQKYPPKDFDKKFVEDGSYYWRQENRAFGKRFVDFGSWMPSKVLRYVPKKVRTRHNPKMPSSLKNNDLVYFKYDHQRQPPSKEIDLYSIPISGGYERFFSSGYLPSDHWVENHGLLQNPFEDLRNFHSSEYRIARDYILDIDALIAPSLTRLYSRIKNQHIDLATELSQFSQARKMIFDLSKRLVDTMLTLKQGKVVKAFKKLFPNTPKQLANDRLAYVYGVKPLVEDIQGAAVHLQEYLASEPLHKVNGHAKKTIQKKTSLDIFNEYGLWGRKEVTVDVEIRVKHGASFRITGKLLRQLAKLGFTNPVNVAWESIPFSFVVDWFLPIGSFVNGLNALDGMEIDEVYRTVFVKETVTVAVHRFSQPSSASSLGRDWFRFLKTDSPNWWFEKATAVYCKRTVLPFLPKLPYPSLKSPISKDHSLNLAALVSQLRK